MGIICKSRIIEPEVELLRYYAFANDPLARYVNNDDDHKPSSGFQLFKKILFRACLTVWIRTRYLLTVNAGSSLVLATPPKDVSNPGKPGDRIADFLTGFILENIGKLRTGESRKRQKEYNSKMKAAISDVLGERWKEMFTLNLLATEPASQGLGYGGALVDAVSLLADLNSQATWLVSSNNANTGFYESHGFTTVGEVLLGDQNPTWHKPPVVVKIMVREFEQRFKEKRELV